MKIAYHEKLSLLDFGPGHPMRGDRYIKALERFKQLGLDFETFSFPMASEEELLLFHTPSYLEEVKQISSRGWPDISPDTPGFRGIYEAAAWSVGATLEAVRVAMKEGIAANLAGGWHHAFPDRGRGFCVFSDTGVAASYLKREGAKVLILDYDAHHGDGIQLVFGEDSQVITLSIHQDPSTLYPYSTGFVRETHSTNINIPLPPGAGDRAFVLAIEEIVPALVEREKPDFLIVEMGVDGHCACYLSQLSISYEGYRKAASILRQLKQDFGFKMVLVGGGGFNFPYYADAWAVQLAEFQGGSVSVKDTCSGNGYEQVQVIVEEAKKLAGL